MGDLQLKRVTKSFGKTDVLRPYYIVARLPCEPKEEFLLIQPFTLGVGQLQRLRG